MAAQEVPSVVRIYDTGIDLGSTVNIEVDFDDDEAREILSFMSRYKIPTYADAVRLMAMLGAGTAVVDPTGATIRMALRGAVLALCILAGALLEYDFGGIL